MEGEDGVDQEDEDAVKKDLRLEDVSSPVTGLTTGVRSGGDQSQATPR